VLSGGVGALGVVAFGVGELELLAIELVTFGCMFFSSRVKIDIISTTKYLVSNVSGVVI
jgi:hypothetical protein